MSTSATDLNIIKFSPKTNLNTNPQIPEINKLTAENVNEILNFINGTLFPVGTILFNDNSDFDPNVEYGGTWELIKGKMIIGFDDTDDDFNTLTKTGGSKTHTQAGNEVGSHIHKFNANWGGAGSSVANLPDVNTHDANAQSVTLVNQESEEVQPMDIMNPYYVANIWHRVA